MSGEANEETRQENEARQEEVLTRLGQAFQYEEVERSSIRLASYNPRKISKAARRKLDDSIERFGCVELLVWNRKTGNLVSGHQRIALLDERHEGENYKIAVAVVDLDSRDEKALNVQFNNRFVQGEFSRELIGQLLRDQSERPDLSEMGFSKLELEMTVGVLPELRGLVEQEEEASAEAVAEIEEIKRRKREHKKNSDASKWSDTGYYLVVAADSIEEKAGILQQIGAAPSTEHVLIAVLSGYLDEASIPPEIDETAGSTDEQDTVSEV